MATDPLGVNIFRKFGENPHMGLGCETPTRFIPTATAALTAQGTTITPAFIDWG